MVVRALAILLIVGCGVPRGSLDGDAAVGDGSVDVPVADVPVDVPLLDTCMPEECNGFDDDCDGNVDETCPCTPGMTQACGCDGMQMCDDGAWGACTGGRDPAPEECNTIDDDCDGRTDEEPMSVMPQFRDADMDGFGDRTMGVRSCETLDGYVDNSRDCDDGDPDVNPSANEVCGGVDEDCDMRTDEAGGMTYYRDADGDGFGDASMTMTSCSPIGGFVTNSNDCDDDCELCYPGFPGELCDGLDNDCSATTDEGDCECSVADVSTGIYLVCDDISRSWDDARAYCMARGGDLVSINTMAEQTAVWALMGPSGDSFWIGGEDTDDGDWEWVDGTAYANCEASDSADCMCLQYCNWRADRPNGSSQDCAWIEHNRNGTWDDQDCSQTHEFVCEL